MDKNWNNGSNSDENLPTLGFESLSLGQKLLSKCLKKTGISVSVRGIAVNTTSQIKVAGSAWKSEAKYDATSETKTGTLDDVSFPDLLGSSNREVSVNNQTSERSSVTNDNERSASKEPRRNRYKVKHRLPIVQAVNNTPYHPSRDGSYSGSSFSFKNSPFDEEEDIVGNDFLMPGMKGNYPLGFTNFIGKGVRSPPPPPPPLPYPTNSLSIYQSYQQYSITRLKPGKSQANKTHVRADSPASESNWLDNKSDGYNEAELTTAIDSLNNSILADRSEGMTIKPFVSDKLAQSYLDLSNFEDNTLLLQDSLSNQLDGRLIDQLENQLDDRIASQLSSELETTLDSKLENAIDERLSSELGTGLESSLSGSLSAGLDKRKKGSFLRRKRFTTTGRPQPAGMDTQYPSRPQPRAPRPRRERTDKLAPSQTLSGSSPSLLPNTPTLSSLLTKSPVASRKPPELSSKSSVSKIYNIPKPPINGKPDSALSPDVERMDTDSSSFRRPRLRPRPKRKDIDEDWRSSANTVEPTPNENAVMSENVHERRHFRNRPRFKHPSMNNARSE
ncbi:conserved hypothetical protein [Theileria orientalis strain Shintoku]|uniref:Uncharacterized protein n=1 Tax=Theileria orientalis strain Shintoku TaxID=869250 RepID=J4C2Z4_THEOR|nr:conserved hypothetical protein [Theileria orientalis strain Shintoku]BAM39546.1 conserved hypothetical protein [Theileria orientalis strain Shintoku]|eukprot:XP_009689847.1 conserved hypothetical protein [Theileria orientalis strain Shintoku]